MIIPEMDLDEFKECGYLLEVNRRFFHPLGLALFIMYDNDTGQPLRLGVFDLRYDPEGCIFDQFTQQEKEIAGNIEREWQEHAAIRQKKLGFVIQPLIANCEEQE